MKNLNKKEIRKLVNEVIEERWRNFFRLKNNDEYRLFTDVEKWMNDMIDDAGHYQGPDLYQYGFYHSVGDYLMDTSQITQLTLNLMKDWNEAYGKSIGMNRIDIAKINKDATDIFYQEHAEAILGEFPNQ